MPLLEVNERNIKKYYDVRYQSNYMIDDDFTTWSHKGVELYRLRDVLSHIPCYDINSVLDYGCGQGGWMKVLMGSFAAAKITGIDISQKAIEKARKRFKNVKFYIFNGKEVFIDDNSFDLVFTYHVLEHVYDIESVVHDISRLVKPEGYICAILPCGNPGSFEEKVTNLIKNGKEKSIDGPGCERFFYEAESHLRRMKSNDIIAMFENNNIKLVHEFYANQLLGAIEWIANTQTGFIKSLFNINRETTPIAKLKLHLLRIFFMFIVIMISRSTNDRIESRHFLKKVVLSAKKTIGNFTSKILENLALLEWRTCRSNRNGSAQYLIFKKMTEKQIPCRLM
jgi:ubiquinone/menaquinone biosynthesis C-methylase UbiE